jgi:hypothetical protein
VSAPAAALLERLRAWAAVVWLGLIGGAGLGFVARDVLQAGRAVVALAWLAGAALGAAPAVARTRGRAREGERGQASVEWVGLVLVCVLALGAFAAFVPSMDGLDAYGGPGAALVRAQAPSLVYERGERQLPVDWRGCRRPECAEAPDEAGLDVHRSDAGERATVFTRLRRLGGRTYIQYWLYYPDSNTTLAGADRAWEASWLLPRLRELVSGSGDWPGYHRDDWESVQVRLDPDGSAWVRASSHGHYQGCKEAECRGRWASHEGWARVSYGSHAGHIPGGGPDPGERTTTAEGLRLIPLETHDRRGYRRLDWDVAPPWRKGVYEDPESDGS